MTWTKAVLTLPNSSPESSFTSSLSLFLLSTITTLNQRNASLHWNMQIRIASPEDLEFIESAYEHARAFMQANGNTTQWPDGYPGRIDAEEDIARGHCFLVADKEGPLGVFSFAPGPDGTYADIEGAWRSNANYHIIHRVACGTRTRCRSGDLQVHSRARGLPALRHLRRQRPYATRA